MGALQAHGAHQALDRAARNRDALAAHLQPDHVCAIDLPVGVTDALDVGHQDFITLGPLAAQLRVTLTGGMTSVARRGHLQHLAADELDPVQKTVLVDKALQFFKRRSSSAWAKTRWPP